MDIIDKIEKTAKKTCDMTINTTNKFTQKTKLKMHINECKSQIEEIYNSIGKKVYEKHVREENIDIKKELKEECEQIDTLSKEIENSIEHLLMLKDMKKCPKCFSEIMIQYNFCPVCGENQNNNKNRDDQIIEKLEKEHIDDTNKQEADIVKQEKENNN